MFTIAMALRATPTKVYARLLPPSVHSPDNASFCEGHMPDYPTLATTQTGGRRYPQIIPKRHVGRLTAYGYWSRFDALQQSMARGAKSNLGFTYPFGGRVSSPPQPTNGIALSKLICDKLTHPTLFSNASPRSLAPRPCVLSQSATPLAQRPKNAPAAF